MTDRGKRFFVETWGCQMNELDSQRMSALLMEQGILPTREASEADVILLNSCSVREKAAHKAYSRLGEYRRFKDANPELLIGFCGCVAQQEGEKALRRIPELDFVIGPARVGELDRILEQRRSGRRVVATGFPDAERRRYDFDRRPFQSPDAEPATEDGVDPRDVLSVDGIHKGMVTIIEGCDKKCTFCIVPTTRGPEQSRRMAVILDEVRHLVSMGYREIELLGQTVNHWRDPQTGDDFAVLLDRVAEIPMVERLRFVTSYPRDFSQEMVEAFSRHDNISPYLHLPVQSGSDRVLKWMGRGYGIDLYLDLVDRLRRARPGLALSTDIIVGFPGEEDADFDRTLDLIQRVRFSQVYAFKYSPRPGTAAPRLPLPAVEPEIADRRLQELFRLQREIQLTLNQELVGTIQEVLVTRVDPGTGRTSARTPCHRVVHFDHDGHLRAGAIVPVRVESAFAHSLSGSAVGQGSQGPRRSRLPVLA